MGGDLDLELAEQLRADYKGLQERWEELLGKRYEHERQLMIINDMMEQIEKAREKIRPLIDFFNVRDQIGEALKEVT